MRFLTAHHCSISYLSPPLGGTFTRVRIEDPPVRRKRAIWRYMWRSYWCIYQLAFLNSQMRSKRGEWHVREELLTYLAYMPEPRSDAFVSRR